LSPPERELLQAYTAGVNAGLSSLGNSPWEYWVLRLPPRPWREEDSLLCVYAMWFDLQDSTGSFELNRDAVRQSLGLATLDFLAPRGNSWDTPFDDSKFAPPALPTLRFVPPEPEKVGTIAPNFSTVGVTREPRLVHGSNAFAVAGSHTATGVALVANDMHLGLSVPTIWYRSVLKWNDTQGGAHRVMGVMLPGMPLIVAGSNGRVAWGFTNSYVDTTDLILAEPDGIANIKYRVPEGWAEIQKRTEEILVKDEAHSLSPFAGPVGVRSSVS
jgi:penicillin amidase